MRAEDQFHIGVVAADFEATMSTLSSVFGYQWGPEAGGPIAVTLPTGEAVLDLRCVFSTTEPRVEIVRSIPDTLWEPVAGSGIHHLGFWSDDVAADTAQLERYGYVVEAARAVSGTPFFAFLTGKSGVRIELVTRAAQEGLARCWADPETIGQQ